MGDTERTRIIPVRKDYETLDEAALVLDKRYAPDGASDRFALAMVKLLRAIADTFFARRYGNRAIVLETVAAVPGMVGGTLQHLKCLRRLCDDEGWIFTLLDEAENERMHLMTFMEIIHPAWYERLIVVLVQAIFYNAFFLLYLISDKTAHRLVGYFEEEGWSAIPSTCSASTAATRRTCRRRSSRSITGACPRMRGCARWWK